MLCLLICGDAEANPGPANQELLEKINVNIETILERTNNLEEKMEDLSTKV